MNNSTLAPSFDASEYDALTPTAQAVVGHAFRYVMAVGTAFERTGRAFSRLEDGRQRAAWRQALREVKGPERLTAALVASSIMFACAAITGAVVSWILMMKVVGTEALPAASEA